jgi:hypothetical protein
MFGTILRLTLWGVAAGFAVTLSIPTTRPGQSHPTLVILALLMLGGGAWFEAGRCRRLPVFFIYGLLAGLPFLLLFAGDYESYHWQIWDVHPHHRAQDILFVVVASMTVFAAGGLCRVVAFARHRRMAARLGERLCRACGHRQCGLPEPCCPKCGAEFQYSPCAESAAVSEIRLEPPQGMGAAGCTLLAAAVASTILTPSARVVASLLAVVAIGLGLWRFISDWQDISGSERLAGLGIISVAIMLLIMVTPWIALW